MKQITAQTHVRGATGFLVALALVSHAITPATPQQSRPQGKAGISFSVRKEEGRWWLVTPAGRRFFSTGVCCVTPGDTWLEYNSKKPAYAAWRQYSDGTAWADATIERLKQWGFSTIDGWSDLDTLKRSSKMDLPYTMVLHLGSSSGAPWWDMWSPKIMGAMEEAARKQILPVRDDPRLLGYYTDNELGWWNGPLFHLTLEQSPQSEQRRRLIQLLRQYYHNDWKLLTRDFIPEKAASFTDLDKRGKLYLRPGGQGMKPVRRFLSLIAERYYALMRQVVRKFDKRGLLLGDRYQSFYYPEVVRACRNAVDVVSTNLMAGWKDGTYPRFYLDTLHSLTGRPVMVGEFYMTAKENRSGNKNDASGFPVVTTQRERAVGFNGTLAALTKTPYVVGADWFQYYDEPTFGRSDGENYNMGLVDIHDKPYEEITAASAALNREILHAAAVQERADARGGVPHAPQDPLAHWQPMEALGSWDRERGFVPPQTRSPIADLYTCWDQDCLYFGLFAMEVIEDSLYKDKHVPEMERAEWTIQVKGVPHPIRIRLGAGRPPVVQGSNLVQIVDTTGSEKGVRNVAAIRLPATLCGKSKWAAGDKVSFEVTYQTHSGGYRVAWSGSFPLAE